MKRWLRRLGYVLVIVGWGVLMSLPVLAFRLADQGEIKFGDNVRLFLVREPDVGGLGVQWTRPLRQKPACSQTTVTYIMWEGKNDNARYCQCLDAITGAALPVTSHSCTSPPRDSERGLP